MRALTVQPSVKDSLAVTEMEEPPVSDGPVLVDAVAVGLCGTDVEIVAEEYGTAPAGSDRLVLRAREPGPGGRGAGGVGSGGR